MNDSLVRDAVATIVQNPVELALLGVCMAVAYSVSLRLGPGDGEEQLVVLAACRQGRGGVQAHAFAGCAEASRPGKRASIDLSARRRAPAE